MYIYMCLLCTLMFICIYKVHSKIIKTEAVFTKSKMKKNEWNLTFFKTVLFTFNTFTSVIFPFTQVSLKLLFWYDGMLLIFSLSANLTFEMCLDPWDEIKRSCSELILMSIEGATLAKSSYFSKNILFKKHQHWFYNLKKNAID